MLTGDEGAVGMRGSSSVFLVALDEMMSVFSSNVEVSFSASSSCDPIVESATSSEFTLSSSMDSDLQEAL